MSLFRRQPSPAGGTTPEKEWDSLGAENHQAALLEIMDAFHGHDAPALAKLTAPERADQLRARQVLQHYLDALWQAPKLRAARLGLDSDAAHPANDPAFSCVAGLLDLAQQLVAEVEQAQMDAGDDTTAVAQEDDLLPFDRFEPYHPDQDR